MSDVTASPWFFPSRPWQRLHLDYAGPLEGGRWLLIVVDSHSKWLDVHVTTSTSAAVTIEKLRQSFATFGLPRVLVTDNATCFTSDKFSSFTKGNGIKHLFSPPYHPASNGQAESLIKVVKHALKRRREGSLHTRLARFLLAYRTAPHSTTGHSPAELMFGRNLRTRIDALKTSLQESVADKQLTWKAQHDRAADQREFTVGDCVFVQIGRAHV